MLLCPSSTSGLRCVGPPRARRVTSAAPPLCARAPLRAHNACIGAACAAAIMFSGVRCTTHAVYRKHVLCGRACDGLSAQLAADRVARASQRFCYMMSAIRHHLSWSDLTCVGHSESCQFGQSGWRPRARRVQTETANHRHGSAVAARIGIRPGFGAGFSTGHQVSGVRE